MELKSIENVTVYMARNTQSTPRADAENAQRVLITHSEHTQRVLRPHSDHSEGTNRGLTERPESTWRTIREHSPHFQELPLSAGCHICAFYFFFNGPFSVVSQESLWIASKVLTHVKATNTTIKHNRSGWCSDYFLQAGGSHLSKFAFCKSKSG